LLLRVTVEKQGCEENKNDCGKRKGNNSLGERGLLKRVWETDPMPHFTIL
jgi:hypothetical protein